MKSCRGWIGRFKNSSIQISLRLKETHAVGWQRLTSFSQRRSTSF